MGIRIHDPVICREIRVCGIVQGVGFRPYVYRLARSQDLVGTVRNDGDGVVVDVEGPRSAVDRFLDRLPREAPARARIFTVTAGPASVRGFHRFDIAVSERDDTATTMIAPDIALCDDCLAELLDPCDRRFRYPFLNCTNCGPRFTIVRRIPYDRPHTSMGAFPLCDDCREEYDDPDDRRFHAQPNACPACGPRLWITLPDGSRPDVGDPLGETIGRLKSGQIAAIRGLGGYHLAVDAHCEASVRRLRQRKGRAGKPFALMAPNLDTVRRYCVVSEVEEHVLTGPERPIVLLEARNGTGFAEAVAPGLRYMGFMLPYTPLHHLILDGGFDALVMTSANLTEEPIATGNDEALDRLGGIADFLLMHDREILQRCDDSVVRVVRGGTMPIRRSRGYVPEPVFLPDSVPHPLLAVGGELKNTIALAREREVFLSQYIGDLDNPRAYGFFQDNIAHFESILEIRPTAIACDLHPEYLSTKWAAARALPRIAVQHHHAHLAAVMAENGVTETTIGLILDGTGYGTDGTIWGGEVLIGDALDFTRFAHLELLTLPGGEAAIRQPWRLAHAALIRDFGDGAGDLDLPVVQNHLPEMALLRTMIRRRVNAPATSSAGRLFDAVSALLGVCETVTYEAQAAIELEMLATEWVESVEKGDSAAFGAAILESAALDPVQSANGTLKTTPLIRSVVSEMLAGEPGGAIALRFHTRFAALVASAAVAARDSTGIERVGLSGGVFQNVLLFNLLVEALERHGFQVLTHSLVPPNDGGLALGQIAVASAKLKNGGR